jgi:hypothetical protein
MIPRGLSHYQHQVIKHGSGDASDRLASLLPSLQVSTTLIIIISNQAARAQRAR